MSFCAMHRERMRRSDPATKAVDKIRERARNAKVVTPLSKVVTHAENAAFTVPIIPDVT